MTADSDATKRQRGGAETVRHCGCPELVGDKGITLRSIVGTPLTVLIVPAEGRASTLCPLAVDPQAQPQTQHVE
jgi:hypothetical protein